MKKIIYLFVAAIIFSAFISSEPDPTTILKKLDEVMYSAKDMTGNNKIILIDKNGKQEVREATIKQKGNDMMLFRFTAPASQAGIAVLSLPNDIMYLYMPAFGKERRIASSAKNQNFAGTDFSYEDMESKKFAEKYNAKLLKTEANGYVLELTPKLQSSYSKVIMKVHKTEYYPISVDLYDKGNKKVKELKYTFNKVGKYWNPKEIIMVDLKKNHTTKMQMNNVKFDTGLTDDEFTVRKLKQ